MAGEPKKYRRKSEAAKKRESNKRLTLRQSRFAEAFTKSKSAKDAAIAAGNSPKYAESAHQALQGIRLRVPDILDNAGYSVPVLIEKHIAPKLTATTTKLAAEKGEFTDHVELEDDDTQLKATRPRIPKRLRSLA
jgi:phage terminase small subunit